MSNSKISALTSVTTPLAGTETLPIVQSSTTKQVSVANLTAGRTVSATTYRSGDGSQALPAYSFTSDTASGIFYGSGYVQVSAQNALYALFGSANIYLQYPVTVSGNITQATAAKGINFTANTPAAGMTSQLLNWYEEGTGTPTRNGFTEVIGAGSITSTYYYTRIGRVVYINITLICTGGATVAAGAGGAAYFTALPFASARYAVGNWLDTTGLVLTGPVGVTSTAMFVGGAGFAATSNAHSFTATYNI